MCLNDATVYLNDATVYIMAGVDFDLFDEFCREHFTDSSTSLTVARGKGEQIIVLLFGFRSTRMVFHTFAKP